MNLCDEEIVTFTLLIYNIILGILKDAFDTSLKKKIILAKVSLTKNVTRQEQQLNLMDR